MNTSEFGKTLSSHALNESLQKMYNVKIDFDKYTREQLENYRNLLRTKVHQVESQAKFNDLLSDDMYQKDKFVLNVLNTRIKEMLGEGKKVVAEKAKSKAQQKFMGMVHAAQKGEKPASKAVAKVAKGMSKKAAKDYATTKHKGLPAHVDEVSAGLVKKHLQKSWDQQDSVNDRLKAGEPVSRKELKRSIRGEKNTDLAVSKLRGTAKVPATSMTEGQTDRSIETYFRDEPVEVSYDFDEYGEIEITGVYNPKTGEDFSDDITSNELHLLASEVYDYLENERDEKGDWEHEMRRDRGFSESRAGNIKGRSKSAKSVEKGTKMKKKSNAKPDFLDKDGDGNKKEPFKKAVKDAGKKKPATKKKKPVKESVHELRHRAYQNFIAEGLASYIAEDEEGKAKSITSGVDMVNDFTSWMQRIGNYQTKTMIELADNIRANFGVQEAETFKASVAPALEAALNSLTQAREEINNAVAVLAGEAPGPEPMGQEPGMEGPMPEPAGDDMMNAPSMDDEFAASDAAAGGPETSGRLRRESIERGNRLMKILGA